MKFPSRPLAAILLSAGILGSCSSAAPAPVTPAPALLSAADYPTPLPPPVGVITFGDSFDRANQRARDVRTQFKANDSAIAWSAAFAESVGPSRLDLLVVSRSAAGAETVILRKHVTVADPSTQVVAVTDDLSKIVNHKPGQYVMRYLRDDNVLAEGTFTIVK